MNYYVSLLFDHLDADNFLELQETSIEIRRLVTSFTDNCQNYYHLFFSGEKICRRSMSVLDTIDCFVQAIYENREDLFDYFLEHLGFPEEGGDKCEIMKVIIDCNNINLMKRIFTIETGLPLVTVMKRCIKNNKIKMFNILLSEKLERNQREKKRSILNDFLNHQEMSEEMERNLREILV